MLAYLTDVEGQWNKLADFAEANPCVRLEGDAIHVAPGCVFVFGGDAIDRGPASWRVLRALVDARDRQPDRVVLLAGNRDLNKLRLRRELQGAPPEKTPAELREAPPEALLPWILANTMGAKAAFGHRRAELAAEGLPHDDAAVARSYLDALLPDGAIARYLSRARLAHLHRGTLVVHGAVTDESLGVVPLRGEPVATVAAWVDALNAFYDRGLDAWRADPDAPEARALIAYQAPVPETRLNQRSVVYGRPTDDLGAPWLPSPAVVSRLRGEGVSRLLVGHTPSGDVPAVLRDEGFTMVLADNSYGRHEGGSRVLVDGDDLTVSGETVLDDGARVPLRYTVDPADPLLGRVDPASGTLLKARLATGAYLAFRALPENAVSQLAVAAEALRAADLVAPYRSG